MSAVLQGRGREHIILERRRIGERWRSERWDSLRFQFPSWSLRLPGYRYAGDDPDGFAHRTQIVRVVEEYATRVGAPVREGVNVVGLEAADGGGYRLATTAGRMTARRVVVASGPFQRPMTPELARGLPPSLHQLDPTTYRGPDALPPGGVLVVGSGASGCQIGHELLRAGRRVILAVSRHRRVPRRFRGRDLYWWLERLGRFEQSIDSFPDRRSPPSVVVTGVDGGYDVDVRRFAAEGMTIAGRLMGAKDGIVAFDRNADHVLAEADLAYEDFLSKVRGAVTPELHAELADEEVDDQPSGPVSVGALESVDLARERIATVIWATGYEYAYDWLRVGVLDHRGAPVQRRGVTAQPGLYFLGLHWMHTFRSGLLSGVGDDAEFIADHMDAASPAC